MTIHGDGLSAIQSVEKSPTTSFTAKKNFDLLNAIIAIRLQLPIIIKFAHIKGHQDAGTAYSNLSVLAQLNVLADDLAKTKAKHTTLSNSTQYQQAALPFSSCVISTHTKLEGIQKINSELISTLRHFITKDDLRQYWIYKKDLQNLSHHVD